MVVPMALAVNPVKDPSELQHMKLQAYSALLCIVNCSFARSSCLVSRGHVGAGSSSEIAWWPYWLPPLLCTLRCLVPRSGPLSLSNHLVTACAVSPALLLFEEHV
jgi:hypothetical protein